MRLKSILFVLLLLPSCVTPSKIQKEKFILSIEKLRCMGDCPVFTLKIYENGLILYDGKMFVSPRGEYYGKIRKKELDKLKGKFLENGFFDFKDFYKAQGMDLQTTYIFFSHKGTEKKIRDYSNPPEELRELEKLLTGLIDKVRWRPVKDKRLKYKD